MYEEKLINAFINSRVDYCYELLCCLKMLFSVVMWPLGVTRSLQCKIKEK